MFLRVATLLAIIGLLLTLFLRLIQQFLLMSQFYSLSMAWVFRLLSIAEVISLTVPLIIFFLAFFLSLGSKTVPGGASSR